jgi:hypothetical protein
MKRVRLQPLRGAPAGLEVDDELELDWGLHRKLAWLCPSQNTIDLDHCDRVEISF